MASHRTQFSNVLRSGNRVSLMNGTTSPANYSRSASTSSILNGRGKSSGVGNINRRINLSPGGNARGGLVARSKSVHAPVQEFPVRFNQQQRDGYGDEESGVKPIRPLRPYTPHTEALIREIEALRARGHPASRSPPEAKSKIIKPRNQSQSTYFRGHDATGFHIPNPSPNNMARISTLPETEDVEINREVLEKTLPSTFYSTKLKYMDSLIAGNGNHGSDESNDHDHFHPPKTDQVLAENDNGTVSPHISGDTPELQIPQPRENPPKLRSAYYSRHGVDELETDEDKVTDGSIHESQISSSGDEDDSEANSNSKSADDSSPEQTEKEDMEDKHHRKDKKHGEKKVIKKTWWKEKAKYQFDTLKSKEDIGKAFGHFGVRPTTPNTVTFQAAINPKQPNSRNQPQNADFVKTLTVNEHGFLKNLYKQNSILGKNIDEIEEGLEGLYTDEHDNEISNVKLSSSFAAIPGRKPQAQHRPISHFPSARPPAILVPRNDVKGNNPLSTSKPVPVKHITATNQTTMRSRNSKCATATESTSSVELIEKIKVLHDKVANTIPKSHPTRKLLMGGKSLLSTAPSNVTIRARGRQPTTSISTKSGLTLTSSSSNNGMDSMDDLFREHNSLTRVASLSASKAKREVDILKQKLGVSPGSGLKLKPSSSSLDTLATLSNATDSVLENPSHMSANAQLKLPQPTKSSKLIRNQFQERDAQMVAARRQAILAKEIQQRSKYLLTDEELKQRINRNRASPLAQPTQVSMQKMNWKPPTYIPKEYNHLLREHENQMKRSRFGATGNSFQSTPTIHSIPKRGIPAWRSI